MRAIEQLVHSRTRVGQRYALMPLEGYPFSKLPACPEAQVRVLTSPAMGAEFVQMLVDLPKGVTFPLLQKTGIETFYFVLTGHGQIAEAGASPQSLKSGSFGLLPPTTSAKFSTTDSLSLLLLQKRYESAPGIELFTSVHSHESAVKKEVWADNPHSLLQTLVPDSVQFDLAMNIFTFDPGFGLPIVETHVMEHGLYFLQGKGLYFLAGEWMEVQANDFIWMGPYCPQSFYATGPTPSRYLYYKNVNRDIPL